MSKNSAIYPTMLKEGLRGYKELMRKIKISIIFILMCSINLIGQKCDSISKAAFIYYKNKDYQNASRLYKQLQMTDSLSDKDYLMLGMIHYRQSEFKSAISIFTELSLKDAYNVNARYWLANSYCKLDSSNYYSIARPYFYDLIKKAEADTVKYAKILFDAYHYFASYYTFKELKADSGIYYANKMVTITPSNKRNILCGYQFLSLIYEIKFRDNEMAKIYACKMLEIDPDDKFAQQLCNSYKDKQLYFKKSMDSIPNTER